MRQKPAETFRFDFTRSVIHGCLNLISHGRLIWWKGSNRHKTQSGWMLRQRLIIWRRALKVILPFILRVSRARRPQAVHNKSHHYCSARALILRLSPLFPSGLALVLVLQVHRRPASFTLFTAPSPREVEERETPVSCDEALASSHQQRQSHIIKKTSCLTFQYKNRSRDNVLSIKQSACRTRTWRI